MSTSFLLKTVGYNAENKMPVELIKSTTKLTTSDMTEYQNAIEIWAQTNLGWMWDYNEL